jgi:hypothetical protein
MEIPRAPSQAEKEIKISLKNNRLILNEKKIKTKNETTIISNLNKVNKKCLCLEQNTNKLTRTTLNKLYAIA